MTGSGSAPRDILASTVGKASAQPHVLFVSRRQRRRRPNPRAAPRMPRPLPLLLQVGAVDVTADAARAVDHHRLLRVRILCSSGRREECRGSAGAQRPNKRRLGRRHAAAEQSAGRGSLWRGAAPDAGRRCHNSRDARGGPCSGAAAGLADTWRWRARACLAPCLRLTSRYAGSFWGSASVGVSWKLSCTAAAAA